MAAETIDLILMIYFTFMVIFLLNSISGLMFRFTWSELKATLKSVSFIFVWPLAIWSPGGRAILFKRLTKL